MKRIAAFLRNIFRAGHGRPAALAMLAGVTLLMQFPDYSPWQSGQLELFDQYQRVFPRQRASEPVVIVEIDEASLKTIGQWPWPRNRTAQLIDAIAAMNPLAIGLDLYMPEPDQTSPRQVAGNLPPGQDKLARALATLPSHEERLAEALAHAPTVLGAAGFDFETLTTTAGLRAAPLRIAGGDALPYLRRYPFVLASLPELQAAARGQALLSVDLESGVVRRAPLVAAVNDQPVAALAMEMLRIASGSDAVEVQLGRRGIEAVSVADLTVPTQENGEVWLHYAEATADRYVSAADVLAGKVPAERFENKLVLVGLTGFGLADMRITALGSHVPGVEIQAQLMESFFDGRFLLRPASIRWLEIALLLGGGIFLVWAVPTVRPKISTALTSALFVMLFGAGFVLFRTTGLLLDAASLFASLNVVFGSLLSSVFIETDRQRRHAETELQLQRESAAKVAGELAAASRIQMGSLPDAATSFPGETRFEVAALLEPARAVGGDLYDFFMLDANRLFFVVGDVSGKGVPASLFMVVTKALAKSAALRGTEGIGAIVATANLEMSRENPESLFVTLLAGILDADSGALELCNAGHDAPWRIGKDGAVRVATSGGPPLCVLDRFPYPVDRGRLAPGECLCLSTDGISEAMNAARELYGNERLAAALGRAGTGPAEVIAALHADVHAFVADAEPSDDLTLLAIRYNGR